MRRRDLIKVIASSAASWPLAVHAQQPTMPVIGVLNMQTPESESTQVTAIRQGLKVTGFVEGQNMVFDLRFAEGHNNRLPTLAAELVWRRVNLIVANTTPPAIAAKAATATIPIVFVFGADPVELGLVASFNRPGGNITGVAFLVNKLVAKRLELLCEVVPKTATVGMLVDPNNPNAESDVKNTQAGAIALGRKLIIAKAGTQNELDAAFIMLVENRVGALFVAPNANFRIWRNRLLESVAQHQLPSSYLNGDFVRAGGLMSHGPD
jgi:putative tryptophan/tyrosine transport system substrate-binding protein